MDDNGLTKLEQEIHRLRRECQTQRVVLSGCVLAIAILLTLYIAKPGLVLASTTDTEGNLHVRGLIVEDQSGHERLRLGAPLPDPMVHGVRYKRQGAVSGLSISDSDGNERGGIVTSDKYGEAFFALDSQDQQQVLFLVNPKGGVNFDLFDSLGNEANLTVFPKGPHFVLKRLKEKVAEIPSPAQ